MSMYARLDTGAEHHLASNTGWGDLCRWADGLDASGVPELAHLRHHGWEQDLPALARQLALAVQEVPPPDDVRHTATGFLRFLADAIAAGAGAVVVTDGLTATDLPEGGA